MPKPLPPLPPKVDQFMRARNLTVLKVARDLDISNGGLYDWFPSGHVKLAPYIKIAESADISLNELYRIITSGQGPQFVDNLRDRLKVSNNAGVGRKLHIGRTVVDQIAKDICECKTLEKAHRIANYFDLEIEDLLEPAAVAS